MDTEYECFLINSWLEIGRSKKNRIALFKGVLDIDLKPRPGVGTLGSGDRK